MSGLRTVEEHLATILAAVRPLETETVPIVAAAGRTLAAPVLARSDLPAFDNSAMDGFAVRYDDVSDLDSEDGITLRVVADLPAGAADDPAIDSGTAARIMTGSALPSDADAIVPFEDTAGGLADSLDVVRVLRAPARRGAHVRRRGEDARTGDEVLAAGVALGPLQLAAAAASGNAHAEVTRRPRVAVISTGSELVEPGQPLRRGQIPESNSLLLAGLAEAAGADVIARTSVPDDPDALTRALAHLAASGVDAVVFSGGVSAGAYEVVKQSLAGTMTFSKVAMQPGKPQGFGAPAGGPLLFGLPGNPVSAAVSFDVFVRPALLAMQRRLDLARPLLSMPAAAGWRTPPGRRQYLPVTIDRTMPGEWRAVPATSGGSHLAGGLGRAEAYAVIAADVDSVSAGDLVDVMLIS